MPVVDLRGRCTGQRGNAVKVKPVASCNNLKLIRRKGKEREEEGRKHSKYLGTRKSKDTNDPNEPSKQIQPCLHLEFSPMRYFFTILLFKIRDNNFVLF